MDEFTYQLLLRDSEISTLKYNEDLAQRKAKQHDHKVA